jgi:hypothetical protein
MLTLLLTASHGRVIGRNEKDFMQTPEGSDHVGIRCQQKHCGWWSASQNECVPFATAGALHGIDSTLENLLEHLRGQRQ